MGIASLKWIRSTLRASGANVVFVEEVAVRVVRP